MDFLILKEHFFTIKASNQGIVQIEWKTSSKGLKSSTNTSLISTNKHIIDTQQQLEEYWYGKRKFFELTLDPIGTHFQMQVWRETKKIPFGKTISYGELARKIQSPKSYRAVAQALSRNNIPIVIPCHRVISSNGKIGGYNGGVEKKIQLLQKEKSQLSFET